MTICEVSRKFTILHVLRAISTYKASFYNSVIKALGQRSPNKQRKNGKKKKKSLKIVIFESLFQSTLLVCSYSAKSEVKQCLEVITLITRADKI